MTETENGITFSKSLVDQFYLTYKLDSRYRNQRIGQAFYNFFQLEPCNAVGDLYELDGQAARDWIASHTDWNS